MIRLTLHSTLFPYTTLFRSVMITHDTLEAVLLADRIVVIRGGRRSEEHTSELQSLRHLVCRLLLEKKNAPTYAQELRHIVRYPACTDDGQVDAHFRAAIAHI